MLCGLSGSGRSIGHAALDEGSGFLMRGFARQFTTIGMVGWPLLTEVDPRAGMLGGGRCCGRGYRSRSNITGHSRLLCGWYITGVLLIVVASD